MLFLMFFLLWILMAGAITVHVVVSGVAMSVGLYLFCRVVMRYRFHYDLLSIRKLRKIFGFAGYLLLEMLKAGLTVMKLIYTRGQDMEPVLVRFDTELKTAGARAMLADAITLTAGTITVQDEDGHLRVHALDRSLAEGIEHSEFERRLKELEEV